MVRNHIMLSEGEEASGKPDLAVKRGGNGGVFPASARPARKAFPAALSSPLPRVEVAPHACPARFPGKIFRGQSRYAGNDSAKTTKKSAKGKKRPGRHIPPPQPLGHAGFPMGPQPRMSDATGCGPRGRGRTGPRSSPTPRGRTLPASRHVLPARCPCLMALLHPKLIRAVRVSLSNSSAQSPAA